MSVAIIEREMSEAEFAQMNAGFDLHGRQFGCPPEIEERHGFVALEGERFIGCSSGLIQRHENDYAPWGYLTDLFVEAPYRGQGLGAELLRRFEERVRALGVRHVYTWTAGYEAPGFYKKQGYQVFVEMEDWYPSGHARVGLRKTL